MTPWKYLLIIETVLFKRFPKELAKSELHLSTNCSGVKEPSCPNVTSLVK